MRTITKICLFAFMIICGFQVANAQQPTVSAPKPPTRNAADVKSIYSNAYTNITTLGQASMAGQTTLTEFITPFTNDNMIKFTTLNYASISCSPKLNISDMDSLHIDGYLSQKYSEVKMNLLTYGMGGNPNISVPMPKKFASSNGNPIGSWISVNLPLQYFKDLGQDCTAIDALYFAGKVEVYIDNVYAFKGLPTAVNNVHEDNSFKLYPTIVSDKLSFESAENITKMSIYNTTGQLVGVYNVNNEKSSIDLSLLCAGSYIVSAQFLTGKALSKRIIKL